MQLNFHIWINNTYLSPSYQTYFPCDISSNLAKDYFKEFENIFR